MIHSNRRCRRNYLAVAWSNRSSEIADRKQAVPPRVFGDKPQRGLERAFQDGNERRMIETITPNIR